MADRTVIHVGAMKSGTSHVQSRLFRNRDRLLEAGVLVPGRAWPAQVQGAKDLIRAHGRDVDYQGAWPRLARQVDAHPGTAVVSMEYLGPVRPAVVRGIAASVRGLEVVVSVRDLNRSLAAMWQETIQNGRSWTWQDYLAAAEAEDPFADAPVPESVTEAGRTFWRQQDVVRMVRAWSEVAPVTVVTVPRPQAPRRLLWERFCGVLGAPLSPTGGWADAEAANESIGAASALVLRRLNELLDAADLRFPGGSEVRKQFLAKQVLAARKSEEPAIGLPVQPWVRRTSARMVEALSVSGARLAGAWEELEPVEVPGVDPATVPEADMTDAALAGLAAMVLRAVPATGPAGDRATDRATG